MPDIQDGDTVEFELGRNREPRWNYDEDQGSTGNFQTGVVGLARGQVCVENTNEATQHIWVRWIFAQRALSELRVIRRLGVEPPPSTTPVAVVAFQVGDAVRYELATSNNWAPRRDFGQDRGASGQFDTGTVIEVGPCENGAALRIALADSSGWNFKANDLPHLVNLTRRAAITIKPIDLREIMGDQEKVSFGEFNIKMAAGGLTLTVNAPTLVKLLHNVLESHGWRAESMSGVKTFPSFSGLPGQFSIGHSKRYPGPILRTADKDVPDLSLLRSVEAAKGPVSVRFTVPVNKEIAVKFGRLVAEELRSIYEQLTANYEKTYKLVIMKEKPDASDVNARGNGEAVPRGVSSGQQIREDTGPNASANARDDGEPASTSRVDVARDSVIARRVDTIHSDATPVATHSDNIILDNDRHSPF